MNPRDLAALRLRIRRSLIVVPCLYIGAAVFLGNVAPALDRHRADPGRAAVEIGTARDILTATATGMIAFSGLVVAGVLVVVQFAAGQYSPRLVLWFRRDVLVQNAIGSFLAAPIYALVALRELELNDDAYSLGITVGLALVLLVGAAVLFLALLQRITDRLRPRALYAAVLREGLRAARETYPQLLPTEPPPAADGSWRTAKPRSIRMGPGSGVITSYDHDRLLSLAIEDGATLELVFAVGEFVAPGEELMRVHGGAVRDEARLRAAVLVGDERTIGQDPAFAMRIIVDTAIRALSPAVNDPTTGVQAIDSLQVLVAELGGRDLDGTITREGGGQVRVVWRGPDWQDYLDLAFDEIRAYGVSSVQICRRLRAVVDDLRASTPPARHVSLAEHERRLDAAVRAAHPEGSPERALALEADRTGIGLRRRG